MKPKVVWNGESGDYAASLGWSSDDRHAAVLGSDGMLMVFCASSGATELNLQAHEDGGFVVVWHPRDLRLATCGQDGSVRIWQPGAKTPVDEFQAGSLWVEKLAWSPDGRWLAAGAGRQLTLWKDGRVVHLLMDHASTISGLAWSPDGNRIAVACYGGVRIWDPEAGRLVETLPWKTSLISLSWSSDRRWLVAGTQENAVQIWELPFRAGEELAMSGYEAKVHELAWHHSGRYLATGGGRQIMVWDCGGDGPAGSEPRMLDGHESNVISLVYPHRGHILASGAGDGRILLWNAGRSTAPLGGLKIDGTVTNLAWNHGATALLAGSDSGRILRIDDVAISS